MRAFLLAFFSILLFQIYRNLFLESLLKRDNGLCPSQSERLQFVVDNAQQMLIVFGINLDKKVILPCCVMTFDHFRYRF